MPAQKPNEMRRRQNFKKHFFAAVTRSERALHSF
jgi:hypothetical protein